VVANEVKTLSSQTRTATEEISRRSNSSTVDRAEHGGGEAYCRHHR
jgi:methyl-accepting chemotaxis protein